MYYTKQTDDFWVLPVCFWAIALLMMAVGGLGGWLTFKHAEVAALFITVALMGAVFFGLPAVYFAIAIFVRPLRPKGWE
jgi:uncharacterized membrane protein YhaH (DUF805 family)